MYSTANNLVTSLLDEISLEGLDGITLEALWTRLGDRANFTCALDDHSKRYFWSIIRSLGNVDMYVLQTPRPPLLIFNRYKYVDSELGIVLEPSEIPDDIYPHCPIEDNVRKVRGSCSTYNTRRKIDHEARKLSYEQVIERWNSRLVIVANQDTRNSTLMGLNTNPHLELTIMQYCVLERIGRSRYMGEVTQGKVSLQVVVDDPKALFYHRKFLMRHNLVNKQVHHQKSGSQNCTGSLMHLPRFHLERKPKALFLTEKVIEILKGRPNNIAEYEEIRKELGLPNSLKKLFKTLDFQRYVRTDLRLPYRELYPDATIQEWKHKGSDREKNIRVIQLINPDMDIRDIWAKEDELEEEEVDGSAGVSDSRDFLLDRSILSQAFKVIENAGPEGLSQMELSVKMGVSKLQSRTLCRNLLRKKAVSTFMNDVGRQRVFRYMSRKYEKEGKLSSDFRREKDKMLKLVGKKKSKTKQTLPEASEKRPHEDDGEGNSPVAKKVKTEDSDALLEQNIETKVLEVMTSLPGSKSTRSGFTEELMNMESSSKDTPSPNITYRILRRANIIIEAVRAHKVIDDLTKLMKHIIEEEDKEGYNVKIDKKSLLRLLVKLSKDGHIKVIKIVLKGGTKEKMLTFVCEPHITTDHTIIQSAVEQAKMKFFIIGKDSVPKLDPDDSFASELIYKSMKELKSISPGSKEVKLKSIEFVYDSKIGKKYGFSPKFVRMQILHQFLFYLVYAYTGHEDLDQGSVIGRLREKENCMTDEIAAEMSVVYSEDLDWKMFIPPLPKHTGWPEGWAIMCDLLLRLPLCIFVKVFNVSFIIPELEEFLLHPVRRNYLVKHLPSRVRNVLTVARRYIFSIHEVMQRLCFVGLIQFGPQRLKEKDQVFVYLNRRTTLLDTTVSRPSYHQISDDIVYTEHKYEFHSLNDIDKYWYELWNFCIHTQLGGRMHVTGKDIVLEVLQNKQVMIEAIQPRQPAQAPLLDTGQVPGDKRGAAGLDSAFFSHLKRNWNWTNTTASIGASSNVPNVRPQVVERRKARLASLRPEPLNLGEIFQKPAQGVTTHVKKRCKAGPKKQAVKPVAKLPKKDKVIRHVMPRKKRKSHRPYYDEVDMKALQLMSKLRVEWSSTEDNLLLLCKVAYTYMCPNPRKQIVTFQMVRDVLHVLCPDSCNKTSKACQRRILYVMKNAATAHSVALHLEDVRQDPRIIKQFQNAIPEIYAKTDNPEEVEKLVAEKFRLLVDVLQRKFNPEPLDYKVLQAMLPDSIQELRDEYELVYPSPTIKKRGRFQEVKNVVDIYCSVVNAIIHSSLCCVSDKTSYTYQLFQVYQQYPDNLLRSTMAKIRGDQMVSLKKSYMRLKQKTGNYLPVSSSPYQLSISYVHQLQTRYQYEVFHESYVMSKMLCRWYYDQQQCPSTGGMEAIVSKGGSAATLIELFTRGQLCFDVEIPEQVIILDPRVSEKDETYARIVQRYRDILRGCKSGKDATSSLLFKKPYMEVGEPSTSESPDLYDPDFGEFQDLEGDDLDEQHCTPSQQNAIARAASRIALYMMREELGDSVVGEKQHAHDFFVVNSCKVFCNLFKPGKSLQEPGTSSDVVTNEQEIHQECERSRTNVQVGDTSKESDKRRNEGELTEQENKRRCIETKHASVQETSMETELTSKKPSVVQKSKVETEIASQKPATIQETSMETKITLQKPDVVQETSLETEITSQKPAAIEETSMETEITLQKPDVVHETSLETEITSQKPAAIEETSMETEITSQKPAAFEENSLETKITLQKPDVVEETSLETEITSQKPSVVQETSMESEITSQKPSVVQETSIETEITSKDIAAGRETLIEPEPNVSSSLQGCNIAKKSEESIEKIAEVGNVAKSQDRHVADRPDSNENVPDSILDDLLPLSKERIQQVLDEISSSTLVPDEPVFEDDVHNLLLQSGATPDDWKKALQLLEFTKKKKEIGATMKELRGMYRSWKCSMPLASMLRLLQKSRVLYRCGVTTVHYVYHLYVKPWLVHSYKLVHEDRKAQPHAPAGAVLNVPTETDKAQDKIRAWRRRRLLATAKEVELAVQTLNLSESEKIRVAIRPWVRVDGSVNRRVLDRLLGTVLGHSMNNPGSSMKAIADRFSPALQPFQVRDLIEILEMLGCVRLFVVRLSCRTTLFSKPSTVKISPADGTEDESKISVEPQLDAVLRLGQFIGDKQYAHDFLTSDP